MKYSTAVEEIRDILKDKVTSKRLRHSEGVLQYSQKLCRMHGYDEGPCAVAAIAHDLFRDMPKDDLLALARKYELPLMEIEKKNPILLHGKISACYLEEHYGGIEEIESIKEAVSFHIGGYPFNSYVGYITFISDGIETGRKFKGVEKLRELSLKNLERCYEEVLRNTLNYTLKKDLFLLPESVTAWNRIKYTDGWSVAR